MNHNTLINSNNNILAEEEVDIKAKDTKSPGGTIIIKAKATITNKLNMTKPNNSNTMKSRIIKSEAEVKATEAHIEAEVKAKPTVKSTIIKMLNIKVTKRNHTITRATSSMINKKKDNSTVQKVKASINIR